jgi:hypothetical protein
MWRYVLWPWGTVLVSLLVSLCGCGEEPRPPIVLEDCKQNTSFLPGSKLELQVNPRTEYYCLPTNLTEQSVEDRTFRLVANNGFLLDISAFDNDERSSEITLSYTVVEGRVDPTSLNRSCYRQDRIVEIRTDNVDFSALVNMSIIVGVGGVDSVIRYFTPGLHLPSSDTFTLEDIKNRATALLSVVVLIDERPLAPIFDYKVCEVPGGSTGLIQSPNFSVGRKMSDEIHVCTTLTTLQDKDLFIELSFNNPGDVVPGEYKVVVRARECDALITSPEITIIVPPSPTETPTESPSASPTTTTPTDTETGGLSGGEIVGIVVVVIIVLVVPIVTIAIVIWKYKLTVPKRKKNGSHQESPDERYTTDPEQPLQPPVDTPDAIMRVCVCDLTEIDSDKIYGLLAQHEQATVKRLLENFANGLSFDLQLHTTVKGDDCARLYIVYPESMEWLMANHHEVWKFVRDFQTRSLHTDLLNKVVLVRLHTEDHDGRIPQVIEGPLLCVSFLNERWRNDPDDCFSVIRSKLRMVRDTTGRSTDAAHTCRAISLEGHEVDFAHSLSSTPPSAHSQPDIQPNPVTATPPPEYRGTPPPTSIGTEPALSLLTDIRNAMFKAADNTGRIADGMEGIGQKVDEIHAVTNDTNDQVHGMNIQEEAPPNI